MRIRIEISTLAVCLTLTLSQAANGASLRVSPVHPTNTDSVLVVVSNTFSSGCWWLVSTECSTVNGDTLSVGTTMDYCHGEPFCSCNDNPWGYQKYCNFGLLPPGTYVAKFTEGHPNTSDRIHTFTQTLSFSVDAVTPTLRRTWGSLKSIYR